MASTDSANPNDLASHGSTTSSADDGRRQRGYSGAPPRRPDGQQSDRAHHGGAQDRRLRASQDDEAGQQGGRGHQPGAPAEPDPAGQRKGHRARRSTRWCPRPPRGASARSPAWPRRGPRAAGTCRRPPGRAAARAASTGSGATARRSPARSRSTRRSRLDSARVISGGPRALSVATTSSGLGEGASRPRSAYRAGPSAARPSAGRRTPAPGPGPRGPHLGPPPTARRPAAAPSAPGGRARGSVRGSLATTPSTTTVAPSSARTRTSPESRAHACRPDDGEDQPARHATPSRPRPGPAGPVPGMPTAPVHPATGPARGSTGGHQPGRAADTARTTGWSPSDAAAAHQATRAGHQRAGGRSAARARRSHPDQRAQPLEDLLADAADLAELVHRAEPAVLGAPVQDALRPAPARPRAGRRAAPTVAVLRSTGLPAPPRTLDRPRAAPVGARRAAAAGSPRFGRTTCSPSTSGRARFTAGQVRAWRAPPAASRASSTRDPAGSRTTPARRTWPTTCTTS